MEQTRVKPLSVAFLEVVEEYSEVLLNEPIGELFEEDRISERTCDGSDRYFEPQSGIVPDAKIMTVSSQTKQENVQFSDQHSPYEYDVDSTMDPTRCLQDTNDAALESFFSRPIKIAEEEWATSSALAFNIDPWSLYFDNKRVANRLSNYNLLRSKLRVKVVINGNGFQYGRGLVSYLPFDVFDTLSTNAALIPQDLVQASQQPHIFLDPTTSTGGEMLLPFFWHRNYLHIPSSEWSQMGQMYIRSINDLKHANGANDVVTISVFAWAEEISMSVLTSEDVDTIIPQMGDETEEANAKGIISGPATAIAKVSNALAIVPQLKPFALATSTAANTVASIAKQFGYSRPPVTKNPEPFRARPISSLANTSVPDSVEKLTTDDKQELSIDPRIAGLGSNDPLVIKDIAGRESYLTTFSWNVGTAPETMLWNTRVSPVTWAESGTGASKAYHFPACCMAAMPFQYWTGSMKIRFQIVASAFHKGRLKIVYDPNFLASNEYNTNYIHVIDIADQQDFTIEVGNGQSDTLLTHHDPGIDSITQMYSTSTYSSQEQGNGVVGVYIVNELTVPNSVVNNDIEINVYVSMGDDFEVFVPADRFQSFVFKPQDGEETNSDAQNTDEPSAPVQSQTDALGPTQQDNALINLVYTGESILSFRSLLKRYSLSRTQIIVPRTDAPTKWYGYRSAFPPLRGNVADAIDVASGPVPYNYFNTLLLHWVVYAFQGWRGGTRHKILMNSVVQGGTTSAASATDHVTTSMYIQREPIGHPEWSDARVTASLVSRELAAFNGLYQDSSNASLVTTGTKGQTYCTTAINPNVEFETPFYSPFRFVPGKQESLTGAQTTWNESYRFRMVAMPSLFTSYEFHESVGEDFQVYFWTGLPRMYYEQTPAIPA